MIDLHLHTTASDGLLSPEALVARVAAAGVTVMAVTDHDTVAGIDRADAAAGARGIRLIPGIEITAVENGRDVHVLGYFFDRAHRPLAEFLDGQRADRRRRLQAMAARLAALGMPIDIDDVLARHAGHAVGRPAIARALVRGGHVATIAEAFDRYLGTAGAAFVPRQGTAVAGVVSVIRDAGGLASLAHPGLLRDPALLERLVADGATAPDAIEVFHSDHDDMVTARLLALADARGLLVTGGSDFHGDAAGRAVGLGRVALPADRFERLSAKARPS
ncbi:MAG TPA: PHP domain-containing protein [Vicinamibacterales bacterium]|nr:PHP domain-containing protein [Vicinamibacterales bacterium]